MKKNFCSRGFSLVELLLVIGIIAILTGAVALSTSSDRVVDAFTESASLRNSLRALRSAWIACWSTTHRTIGVPEVAGADADAADRIREELERFAGRRLDEYAKRYGTIRVRVQDGRAIYIGFAGPWNIVNAEAKSGVKRLLAEDKTKLYDGSFAAYATGSGDEIYIRIR